VLPSTQYKTDIFLHWGELRPVTEWCERNCACEWAYECIEPAGQDAGFYEFYFESQRDHINFILWKT
jgi:hypothetical protein